MMDSVRTLTVPVRTPYRLDLTATALRRLSTNVVDVFDGAVYRRLIGDPSAVALLEVTQPAPDALAVRVVGETDMDVAALVARMLGANVDLDRFYRVSKKWPWLHAIVQNARGVKSPRYPTLWETIVNAVVFQQVSIHAAAAILRRVIERTVATVQVGGVTIAPFVTPGIIVDADPVFLRALGLSINKVVALRTLGRAVLDGELDESELEPLPTPELVGRLERFKGIGPWTAAVIALRGFGRLDVFPLKDSGVARSLRDLSGSPDLDAAPLLAALGDQRGMLYYHLLLGRLAARGEIAW
ncbi:MAG: hypothetical protein NVS2B17_33880 [Candidatus Velthaea sp.]